MDRGAAGSAPVLLGDALAEPLINVNTEEHLAIRAELGLDEAPRWSLGLRLAFRCVFCFSILWLFPSPLVWLPKIGEPLNAAWNGLWNPHVIWIGTHLFGLSRDALVEDQSGSSDTLLAWSSFACQLGWSALAALPWSILDRRRAHYRRLWGWLAIYLRFNLSAVMFGYGFSKAIKVQFPDLSADRLGERLGDFSPMGLLWAFMGYSRLYTFFAGACEILGGALLVFRRTTALGCLIIAGVMANVLLLNLSYDVPVKLYSAELLATALVLLAPELQRLANVLLLNRPAPAADLRPPYSHRWMIGAGLALRFLAFAWIAWQPLNESRQPCARAHPPQSTGLGDSWMVEKMEPTGPARSPPPPPWSRLFFHGEWLSVKTEQGTWLSWKLEQDVPAKRWRLHPNPRAKEATELALDWTQPDPDHLELRGDFNGMPMQIRLARADPGSFPLMQRGFHWVSPAPFNR